MNGWNGRRKEEVGRDAQLRNICHCVGEHYRAHWQMPVDQEVPSGESPHRLPARMSMVEGVKPAKPAKPAKPVPSLRASTAEHGLRRGE